ncbi:hypothetical protein PspLS_10670 [Pyricularia sp. CBS 133598]|nr:hypothetical protein PspLS_10670 [Pyricularia sp. CBS 133598]
MLRNGGLEVPQYRGYISSTSEYEDALKLALAEQARAAEESPPKKKIWIYAVNTSLAWKRDVKFHSVDIRFDTGPYAYKTYKENEWTVAVKIPRGVIVLSWTLHENGEISGKVYDGFGRSSYPDEPYVRIPTPSLPSSPGYASDKHI